MLVTAPRTSSSLNTLQEQTIMASKPRTSAGPGRPRLRLCTSPPQWIAASAMPALLSGADVAHGSIVEWGGLVLGSPISGRLGELPVRIDDEFVCDAGVEIFVAFRRLLEIDDLDIYDLGDGQSVPEDRLHELPVVFQHRRLAGVEGVGLCPAETEA